VLHLSGFQWLSGALGVSISIAAPVMATVSVSSIETFPQVVASRTISDKAQMFVDFLAAGEYESARQLLDPVVQGVWSADLIEERWQTFQGVTGTFVRRIETVVLQNVVSITFESENTTDELLFVFNREGDIVGIDFPRLTVAIESLSIEEIAENFIDAIHAGEFEVARLYLSPVLRAEWTPAVVEQRWRGFQETVGAFRERTHSNTIDNVVLVRAQFDRVEDSLVFIFNEDQQIVGIDFPQAE